MASGNYLRAAAAGASAGLRTFTVAAATMSASGSEWTGLTTFIAVTELVADKLPFTPSRLRPPGLIARLISGGLCGAAIADRSDGSRMIGALLGSSTAVASAYTGHSIRRYLTVEIGWPDLLVAGVEDALAILTARDANALPAD